MSVRRPDAFEEWFERYGKPYEDAVREAGDTPWCDRDNPRRYVIIAQLGLDDDIDEHDLRRALWDRRYTTKRRTA